jgi:hypothetical protein
MTRTLETLKSTKAPFSKDGMSFIDGGDIDNESDFGRRGDELFDRV